MVKSLVQRQMKFRAKRKAQGGMRLDMWLPGDEGAKLTRLMSWRSQTGPQVFSGLIKQGWRGEVEKAAYDGHADAQFEFGAMRAIGEGVNCDYSEAEKWFTKSAEQGYQVDACYNNLAILSIEFDRFKEAKEWFHKSEAHGNKVAQQNLGVLYMIGYGVQRDYCQAAEWFMKSAEPFPFSALLNLEGQEEITQEKITIELKLDDVGLIWTNVPLNLGVLSALGKGLPQDYAKALELIDLGIALPRQMGMIKTRNTMDCENYLAHWLSTFPKDEYGIRDGGLAVTISEKLVKRNNSTDYLYTMAEAYAEAGRFDDAIKTQTKLISKLKQRRPSKQSDAALEDCQNRLNSYINKKPWRDDYSYLSHILFGIKWDFRGCQLEF